MALNAKLVVVGGEVKTDEIKLRLPSTIGRGRGTSIMLPHPLVSRQHCELFEADGQLMVRDLGSLNGTFVNNQKITEAPLPSGELLTIGTVTFRAVYDSQAEVGPPSGPAPQLKATGQPAAASAETIRAKPPAKPAPRQPAQDDDDLAVDFDKPLMPLEDDDAAAGPLHSTRKIPAEAKAALARSAPARPEPKVGEKQAPTPKPAIKPGAAASTSPAAKPTASSKPSSPSKPAPGKPAASRPGDAATIDYKKRREPDDEEPVASSDDDDLDDFLKSLEK